MTDLNVNSLEETEPIQSTSGFWIKWRPTLAAMALVVRQLTPTPYPRTEAEIEDFLNHFSERRQRERRENEQILRAQSGKMVRD